LEAVKDDLGDTKADESTFGELKTLLLELLKAEKAKSDEAQMVFDVLKPFKDAAATDKTKGKGKA